MKINIKTDLITKISSDIITLGIDDRNRIVDSSKLNKKTVSYLNNVLALGDISEKFGSARVVHGDHFYPKVLLIRIGNPKTLTSDQLYSVILTIANELKSLKFKTLLLPINQFMNASLSSHAVAEYSVRGLIDASYVINSLKTLNQVKRNIFQTTIHYSGSDLNQVKTGIKYGEAVMEGGNLTKDLGNLPPNICTPKYLASVATKLGKEYKFKVSIFDQKKIEKLKMGSFLAVAKGSREEPRFITIEHNKGPKNQKPIVLVGKGITFDAGGISIKPSADMDEMKYDMGGAASVMGVMKTVGALNLPLNIIAIIPSCENLPDGLALKPGDIVTSMSGQTIEVLNTDAEGRLILCDALTYAERYKPETVIDIATLTGACVIGLGHHATGLFSNHDPLSTELEVAGIRALDKAWKMPLWEEYQPQLNSNFADMANIGGRAGGSITAACFLSRFAKKFNWAHLDIAGTAWKSGKEKGSTGRPVPLLSQFLIKRAGK